MKQFYDVLMKSISERRPNFGNGDSVLAMLYEAYSECNQMEDAQIKAAFEELYRQMNGMALHEMDRILDPVCSLCRSHERTGFVEGVKIRCNALKRAIMITVAFCIYGFRIKRSYSPSPLTKSI